MAFTWNLGEALGDWFGGIKDSVSNFGNWLGEAGNWIGDTFFGGSHSTNEANMSMNQENIAFQKQENEIARQREDNAVQRAAQDMTAAGLSKTLAAGHPASAQSMTAPSNSISMERNLGGLNAINALTKLYFDKQANERANKLNDAQVDLVESQAKGQQLNNETFMEKFFNEQLLTTAKTEETKANVSFIQSQQKVQDIIGSYKEEELRADIDKVYADIAQTKASTDLTIEQKTKIIKEVENIVQDTLNKEWQGKKTEQEIKNLSREYSLAWYKIESAKHDLHFAQKYEYPVGYFPNGALPFLGHIGKEKALLSQYHNEQALGNYKDLMSGYKKGVDNILGFFEDHFTGGQPLEFFRELFNFSPLNWLLGE